MKRLIIFFFLFDVKQQPALFGRESPRLLAWAFGRLNHLHSYPRLVFMQYDLLHHTSLSASSVDSILNYQQASWPHIINCLVGIH